jgi:hypothetical protein|tara:strand:- start:8 stop:145 length:138 start_codon:yes stop_codon:yes gene_type:complete
MAKRFIPRVYESKPKKKRKGVHSKNNHQNSKTSKNYVKKYRGQGR